MAINSSYYTLPPYVQVTGLLLEGCSFDGNQLMENRRESPSVSAVPPCVVAWVTKETPPPYDSANCVSLPLYYNSDRDKLVTCLEVPVVAGTSTVQWIQSGAALFLKTVYS